MVPAIETALAVSSVDATMMTARSRFRSTPSDRASCSPNEMRFRRQRMATSTTAATIMTGAV